MNFDFGKILQRTHTNTQTFFIYLPKMRFVWCFFLLEGGLLKIIFSINFVKKFKNVCCEKRKITASSRCYMSAIP